MPDIFCLLNHKLTSRQEEELQNSFGANCIKYSSPEVIELWSKISTGRNLLRDHLKPFTDCLREARAGDIVVLQGEFSATFAMVDYSLLKGLIPVCAVTKRIAQEKREGERVYRTYIFEHVCFRRYRYYNELAE